MQDFLLAVGRVALVAIFIQSGFFKLTGLSGFTGMLASKGVPYAAIAAPLAALLEIVAGLLVVAGFKTRYAALALVAFTAVAIYVGHDFWNMTGAARAQNMTHAWKNLSIIGGLLLVAAIGAGRYSLDRK